MGGSGSVLEGLEGSGGYVRIRKGPVGSWRVWENLGGPEGLGESSRVLEGLAGSEGLVGSSRVLEGLGGSGGFRRVWEGLGGFWRILEGL